MSPLLTTARHLLCRHLLITSDQVSYAIGVAEPLSLFVEDYGTATVSNEKLLEIINKNFDLRPGVIVRDLKLNRPIFRKTAKYGHFGKSDPDFTWEQPKVCYKLLFASAAAYMLLQKLDV